MPSTVPVSTQGIDQNLISATGDYDLLERGELSLEQLKIFINRIIHLEVPEGDDMCPPHLYVGSDDTNIGFYITGGQLFDTEEDRPFSPETAIELIAETFGIVAEETPAPAMSAKEKAKALAKAKLQSKGTEPAAKAEPVQKTVEPKSGVSDIPGSVNVSLQGIAADLSKPTGEYEAIEMGGKSAEELLQIFNKTKRFTKPVEGPKDDFCPPAVFTGEGLGFMMDSGSIFHLDSGVDVSPEDAVNLAFNQPGALDKLNKAAAVQAEAAKKPVRKPELAPTDPNLSASSINTGDSSPQVSHVVYKSKKKRDLRMITIVLAWFLFIFGLPLLNGPGVVMWIIAFVGFFLHWSWGKKFRETFKLGFDWNTNTMWWIRGDGPLHYITDANHISAIGLRVASVENTYDEEGMEAGTVTTYLLTYSKEGGESLEPMKDTVFATPREGRTVLAKVKNLYESQ